MFLKSQDQTPTKDRRIFTKGAADHKMTLVMAKAVDAEEVEAAIKAMNMGTISTTHNREIFTTI